MTLTITLTVMHSCPREAHFAHDTILKLVIRRSVGYKGFLEGFRCLFRLDFTAQVAWFGLDKAEEH